MPEATSLSLESRTPTGLRGRGMEPWVEACTGRLDVRLPVVTPVDGRAFTMIAHLCNQTRMCLQGESAPFDVKADPSTLVDMLLLSSKGKGRATPTTTRFMVAVLPGVFQSLGRQEWSLLYRLFP